MNKTMMVISVFIAGLALFILLNVSNFKKLLDVKTSCEPFEKTFAIIKPDAVTAKNTGKIIDSIEHHDFVLLKIEKVVISKKQAEEFYAIHKERPFFKELINYITSGPSVIMVLQKENAIKDWRTLMGATDPAKAEEGTIRKLFGTDITHNAIHGSDSIENAKKEIKVFYPDFSY